MVEHQQRADPDDDHPLEAEQRLVEHAERELQLARREIGVHRVDHEIHEARAAVGLPVVQLDGLHAAQRFEEVARLLRVVHQRLFGGVAQRAEEGPTQQRVGRHRAERDRRQARAVDQHHRQCHDDEQPVEQGLDEAGGQRALHLLHGAEARPHVAGMALLEPGYRQAQQVREHVRQPLQVEARRKIEHGPRADRSGGHLDQHQQPEADPERDQQLAVGAHQHAVDHPLQQEGRQQHEAFERQRKREDLQQRALQAGDRPEQLRQAHALALLARREADRGRELQRHAAEMARGLVETHAAHAVRRVVDHHVARTHLAQHDEVVQVPVQHAGQLQLRQLVELGPHRACIELQALGQAQQVGGRAALERQREAAPQVRQIGFETMPRRDHRQARQPAFGRLALQHQRQTLEAKAQLELFHTRPANPSSGSKIHSIRLRRSSSTSASICMPAVSGCACP